MEDNQTEVAFSKNVIEMITVANNFCSFIEKADDSPKSEIFVYLEKVLPLLFLKGTLLPEVIVDDPESNERFVTEEQWESIFNELKNKFIKSRKRNNKKMKETALELFKIMKKNRKVYVMKDLAYDLEISTKELMILINDE